MYLWQAGVSFEEDMDSKLIYFLLKKASIPTLKESKEDLFRDMQVLFWGIVDYYYRFNHFDELMWYNNAYAILDVY